MQILEYSIDVYKSISHACLSDLFDPFCISLVFPESMVMDFVFRFPSYPREQPQISRKEYAVLPAS